MQSMNSESETPVPQPPLFSTKPVLNARIVEARGVIVRVVGASLRVGEMVRLIRPDTREAQIGEVVGFAPDGALVVPLDGLMGLSNITQVQGCGLNWRGFDARSLLGRTVDGLGRPLDGGPAPTTANVRRPEDMPTPVNPLERPVITTPFATGVRAIDGL